MSSKFLPRSMQIGRKSSEPPQRPPETSSLAPFPPMPALETREILRLRCVIQGDQVVFTLDVPAQTETGQLKEKNQHTRAMGILKDVDPHALNLWKPRDLNAIANDPEETLTERIESFGDCLSSFADRMSSTQKLSALFPDQPPLTHVNIIVETPASGKRRAREPPEGNFDRLKRTKIVKLVPSTLGQPDYYEKLEASERVMDDRPTLDADVPPVPLLYEGFGHFLDIMDGRNDVPGHSNIDLPVLHKAVNELARQMTRYSSSEDGRREAGLLCLNHIFSAYKSIKIPTLAAASIGSVRTDGHNTGDHGAGVVVAEFKNRITGIISDPATEMVGYVGRLLASGMDNKEGRELYEQWRVPCVGITIVGCDIRFYAIIAIAHRLRQINLTPALSCTTSGADGRDRQSLYTAFTAAAVLQGHILRDAKRLPTNPSAIPTSAPHFPAVTRLRKYPSSESPHNYFVFEIQSFFPKRQSNRFLYVAHTPGNQPCLIKFTKQYSIELHQLCADAGHAPRIFAFERLPGGWYAVAMEYIEPCVPIIDSSLLFIHRERWITELRDLVHSFHQKDFVHGDPRVPNVVCKDGSVMLLDFDWGGKEGEAFYPTLDLNDELLQGRKSGDQRISKDDDLRVLKNTLDLSGICYFVGNLRERRTRTGP